mgnify:CR=1 FL=1
MLKLLFKNLNLFIKLPINNLSMNYELANIRQYTNNKGQPYFQIRLKKDCKFRAHDKVIIIKETDFKNFTKNKS